MTAREPVQLPLHPRHEHADDEAETPVCSPKIYVSNEEASLLRELRALRERAVEARRRLADEDPGGRRRLDEEIEQLRARREELVGRREAAFRRKMVMLGHLPPEALDEEIIL